MTNKAQELLQKALSLPENERAELAGSLIASLDQSMDVDSDVAWQEEVARRAADVRAGKVSTTSWEEVQHKARILLHGR